MRRQTLDRIKKLMYLIVLTFLVISVTATAVCVGQGDTGAIATGSGDTGATATGEGSTGASGTDTGAAAAIYTGSGRSANIGWFVVIFNRL